MKIEFQQMVRNNNLYLSEINVKKICLLLFKQLYKFIIKGKNHFCSGEKIYINDIPDKRI